MENKINTEEKNVTDTKDDILKGLKTSYTINNKPIIFKTLNTNIVNKEIQKGLKMSLEQIGQQSSIKLSDKGDYYEIEDGAHRTKAFMELGYSADKIKWKIIKDGELDSYSLAINYLRGDSAPMIIALKLREMKNTINPKTNKKYNNEELFNKTGFPKSQIQRYLQYFKLPEDMQKKIINKGLFSPLHAYYLATGKLDEKEMRIIYNEILSEKLSINETRARIGILKRSKGKGALLKELIGFVSDSVWDTKKIESLVHFVEDKRVKKTYGKNLLGYLAFQDSTSVVPTGSLKNFVPLSRETRESMFNPSIALRCINMWSKEKDTILDPCAGGGTRVKIADLMDRKAIGIDINQEHVDQCNSEKTLAYCRDSTKPYDDIINEEVDYILTCPPYWNIETYGNKENSALENAQTYEEFLDLLKKMFELASGKLKSGKYMTIVVSDFRVNGKFYTFHTDLMDICNSLGLKTHDIVISVLYPAIQNNLQCFNAGYTRKAHEFILTFKKQ